MQSCLTSFFHYLEVCVCVVRKQYVSVRSCLLCLPPISIIIPKFFLIMWQPFLFEVFKYAKILFPFLPVTHFMLTVGKQLQAFNVSLVNPVRITPLFWSKVVSGLLD